MGFMNVKAKLDKRPIGVLLGLFLPIMAFLFFWYFKYGEKTPEQLWYYMTLDSSNRNDLMIFPLLPNLIIFYFTNFQMRWDNFTTGLVGATLFLAIPIVISLIV